MTKVIKVMSNYWTHYCPVSIQFGRGCRSNLLPVLEKRSCLIVTSAGGRCRLENDPTLSTALKNPKHYWVASVRENPDLKDLQKIIDETENFDIETIIAIGGGSVIDTGKVLALALSELLYGQPLTQFINNGSDYDWGTSIPLHVLPTTAGTGSEVTPYATIWDHDLKKKMSLSGPAIYPSFAYVDPELTDDLPREVTLSTGLDAINQAAESIWNKNMTPVTEILAQHALLIGTGALPKLMDEPLNKTARDKMAQASLLAGLAISQTRTSICHSISYPITARFGVRHGIACAFTMPSIMKLSMSVDDDRWLRLKEKLQITKGQCNQELVNVFIDLNESLSVREIVQSKVERLDELLILTEKMKTPERASNALFDVTDTLVSDVIKESWLGLKK